MPLMSSVARKMKALVPFLILACLLYFVGGGVAVWVGLIGGEAYFTYAGIVGGLASVLGLFSLSRTRISQTDINEIELESFKQLGKTAEELEGLEARRATTREEIDTLAAQREEIELLVRKASLALFLREQCRMLEERLAKVLAKDEELTANLTAWGNSREKLKSLEEEIDGHPNVALLHDVLEAAGTERVGHRGPTKIIETVVKVYSDAFRSLLGV